MTLIDTSFFHAEMPPRPMGNYAHLIVVRETDSYALFQTDGELNTARVQAGIATTSLMNRITMFKRKQTTPERLIGRELLRRYQFISSALWEGDAKAKSSRNEMGVEVDAAGVPICDYNEHFCKQCPDCISYGFAIGDSGSEKSKVYSDTCYSVTSYESSHEMFTLNAPYEGGTMSRKGDVTSRINEQDHVRPQTFFPAIITVRDPTAALFFYVLNNLLRTRRYGAQTTRTGTVTNHLLGVVLADGELFSNLYLTQHLYDRLVAMDVFQPNQPLPRDVTIQTTAQLLPDLLKAEPLSISQQLLGDDLHDAINDFTERMQQDAAVRELLQAAQRDSAAYHARYIFNPKKK